MTAPEKPQALTIDEALMDASLWPRQHLAVDVKLEFRENGLFAWADLYGIPERPVSLTYVPLTPEGAESTTPTQLVAQLLSQALGRPVVERDDTAELVEALAEPLRYFLEWREEIESDLGIWASKSQTREAFDQAEAALARVKGGER